MMGYFLVVVFPVVAGRIVVMCVDFGQWPCTISRSLEVAVMLG
jgi:hypothetical protein